MNSYEKPTHTSYHNHQPATTGTGTATGHQLSGGASSFGGIVSAPGGGAGLKGNCNGAAGSNGVITNYTYQTLGIRSYIPSGFVQIIPGSKAPGGNGGYMYSGGGSAGQTGQNGEAGFVAISY